MKRVKWSAMHMTTLAAVALLAAASSRAADPGVSMPGAEPRTMTVRYGDLDLDRPEGVRSLYQRLQSAAERVCGYRDPRNLVARRSWRQCYEGALRRAVVDIADPRLASLHAAGARGAGPVTPRVAARR